MKITILDTTKVKYQGHYLTAFQTYDDIDDQTAQELIDSGDARLAGDEIAGTSYASAKEASKTPEFDPAREGYKGEAKLTQRQKKELEEKGKTTTPDGKVVEKDETPIKPPTPESDVPATTEVLDENGNPMTNEQIAAREAATAAGGGEKIPSAEEATQTGEEV